MLNSSGIISQENKDSNTSTSSRFPGEKEVQTSKKQKILGTNISCGESHKVPDTSETVGFLRGKLTASPCPRNSNSKKVDAGKVKFLPAEDVLVMTSGAKVKTSISQGGSGSQDGSPNTVHYSISKKSPPVSLNAALKSFQQKRPSYRSLRNTKPLTFDNVTSSQQRAVKPSRSLHGKSPLGISHYSSPSERLSNRKREEDQPSSCNVLSPTKTRRIDAEVCHSLSTRIVHRECDDTSKKSDEPGNEASVAPNECVCEEEPIDAPVSPEENGTSNSKILSKFGEVRLNHPAITAIWKGSFDIFGEGSAGELYDGFHAHPPGKLSRKAYNFSKQLPGILQFELLHRCDVWPDIFHVDSPDGHDIALYFFPDDFERSSQKYNYFLELMEKSDLAMRSCLGGVELLIFTSRHLPADSQKLNSQFYLWGVYRSTKGRVSSVSWKENQVGIRINSPENRNESGAPVIHGDDAEVLDMEIDMDGGKDVGRVDKPMQRPFPNGNEVHFKPHNEKGKNIVVYDLSENLDESRKIGDGSSYGLTGSSDYAVGNIFGLLPSLEVENEQCDDPDIPPGFSVRITGDAARMVDVNAISPPEMENEIFESASIGAFKGLSLQPQKPIIDPESPEVSLKCHQVVSHGLSMDCTLQSPSSSNLPVPPTSDLDKFVEEEKAEAQQLEPYTLGFNLEPNSKSNNVEDWDSPVLSLSRPQYLKDGQRWITAGSTKHLQQDDCPEDLQLKL